MVNPLDHHPLFPGSRRCGDARRDDFRGKPAGDGMSAALSVAAGPLMRGDVPLGEVIAFWILGPLSLAGAIGMVVFRNAVHSALSLAGTMMFLGAFYIIEQGPFIGFVQIIVYTGAIMILFLFVLMLVGPRLVRLDRRDPARSAAGGGARRHRVRADRRRSASSAAFEARRRPTSPTATWTGATSTRWPS